MYKISTQNDSARNNPKTTSKFKHNCIPISTSTSKCKKKKKKKKLKE